ncbi:hypothetical protein OHB26_21570 [Nocardia sp. NBC_01503]|uniref:hypothetical protein n=1 Tax=Nocardia sp. NBC_01503 TaxID=2975997 RepID=UPI002E7AC314|nr:hypothetical protein [Nocardia sp. NBC_01503]WTL29576.1 hypothetical protein OHB26_21570 [Nocardia sp. NBC_01503]
MPSAAHGLFDVLTKLSNSIHSLGQPWGGDAMGKQFSEGASGYLASVEALVGNGSTGSDASGAIPVYGQLLVNYGKTIEEAGKAFGLGEDLYAEWMLKNYIDEDAHGKPAPFTGPVSSDPNFGKPSGPPANNQYQGGGSSGSGNSGGGNTGGSQSGGPNMGGHNPGGANPPGANPSGADASGPNLDTGPSGPSLANRALTDSTGPLALSQQNGTGPWSSGNPIAAMTPPGTSITETPVDPGSTGLPGAFGPNAYVPGTDPAGVGPQGNPVATNPGPGGPGGGTAGAPRPPLPGSAVEGEQLATKGAPGGVQSRAAVSSGGMMPSAPGIPGSGAGVGAGEAKEKRRGERRKPSSSADEGEGASGPNDPWQRSGWPVGGQ